MTETDPTGKAPNEAGAKLDSGKPDYNLVLGGFAKALEEVVKVGTFGAQKYSPNGWKEVPNGEQRYLSAMLRHWQKHVSGETVDDQWGLSHLAHMAWNALAVLSLSIEHEGEIFIDDTPSDMFVDCVDTGFYSLSCNDVEGARVWLDEAYRLIRDNPNQKFEANRMYELDRQLNLVEQANEQRDNPGVLVPSIESLSRPLKKHRSRPLKKHSKKSEPDVMLMPINVGMTLGKQEGQKSWEQIRPSKSTRKRKK